MNGLPVDGMIACRKDFFILVVCEHFLSQGIPDLIAVTFGDLDIVVSNPQNDFDNPLFPPLGCRGVVVVSSRAGSSFESICSFKGEFSTFEGSIVVIVALLVGGSFHDRSVSLLGVFQHFWQVVYDVISQNRHVPRCDFVIRIDIVALRIVVALKDRDHRPIWIVPFGMAHPHFLRVLIH